MKKKLLLFLGCFFLFVSGCTMQDGEAVETLSRPDIKWERVWVIEEQETRIELNEQDASFEASCLIHYRGDEPVEDVSIMMASPLTDLLIDASLAENYGSVNPGDQLSYTLNTEYSGWREKIPASVFAEKLIDDFEVNFYVEVSWKAGQEEHSVKFFNKEFH